MLNLDLLAQLDRVSCSPFGAVQDGDTAMGEAAWIIHDLSFLEGQSLNDNTVPGSAISVSYDGAKTLAQRILEVESEVLASARMMSGI